MTNPSFQHEHNGEFYRLLYAVLDEPEKVAAIVHERRAILEETNFTGETVLHWLAVENHTDGIRLLRSLGATIPLFALIEAVEHGHLETIILLLELGADPEGFPLERMLRNPIRDISKRERQIIRGYFEQYGYAVDSSEQENPVVHRDRRRFRHRHRLECRSRDIAR